MQTPIPSIEPARDRSNGIVAYARDGWRLGGAALGFVRANRVLQRFVLVAVAIVLVLSAGVAVTAVALRREAGLVGYALVGVAAYYCLMVIVTAASVGLAGLAADALEGHPGTVAEGWQVIRRRRRTIAGWALIELAAGIPSKFLGSWTVNQLAVLLIGFGWSLLSFFAIPTIALTTASPVAAARHSLRLVRGHWGDAVYSTVYLWVRAVVMFGLPAGAAAVVGVLLVRHGAVVLGAALFATGVAGLALATLLTQASRAVLTVVLYRYAESGRVYSAFPAELLERGVRGPSSLVRRVAAKVEGDRVRRLRARFGGDSQHPG
ncbi:MAG: hypothetical protein QOI85_2386 [Chloroflexota bacterium]|nr:hypothetical protein [Chloroflexota bacterium]